MSGPPYPWQAAAWARLGALRAAARLPHALLVAGPGGTGTRAFAERAAQALLCGVPAEAPCGACPACRQFAAGTHPDAIRVEPPEAGKAIPVDAVRTLVARLALTGAGPKVALIDPAEAMNANAANSLLKTLEEPSGDSVLLLVSRRPGRLLATVRSRCQGITFGLPEPGSACAWLEEQGVADAATWLARAGGAPLAARALAGQESDPDAAVIDALLATLEGGSVPPEGLEAGTGLPLATSVPALARAVEDLLRLAMAGDGPPLHREDRRTRMRALAGGLDAGALFEYLDQLYRSIPGPSSSLRSDIQFEGLLADAAAIGRSRAPSGGRA